MIKPSFKRCRQSQKSELLQQNHRELQKYTDLKEELARMWLLNAVYIVLLVATSLAIVHTWKQFMCNLTLKHFWIIIDDVKKNNNCYTFRVCVSSLITQDAMRMHRILLLPVACLGVPQLSTSPHKRHDFGKKVIDHKVCALIFSTSFLRNISHSKKNSVRYYHKCM